MFSVAEYERFSPIDICKPAVREMSCLPLMHQCLLYVNSRIVTHGTPCGFPREKIRLHNVLLNATLQNEKFQQALLVAIHDEIKQEKLNNYIAQKKGDENHAFKIM